MDVGWTPNSLLIALPDIEPRPVMRPRFCVATNKFVDEKEAEF
jgi:hypothetical protein